jgi:hypothetical protein
MFEIVCSFLILIEDLEDNDIKISIFNCLSLALTQKGFMENFIKAHDINLQKAIINQFPTKNLILLK